MIGIEQKTTAEQRAALRLAGYVHVTGLKTYRLGEGGRVNSRIGEDLHATQLGRSGVNNGYEVIVTMGGEIWLRQIVVFRPGMGFKRRFIELPAIGDLTPRGPGAYVPCSNGEEIRFCDLMGRVSNPDYDPESR